MRWGGSIRLHVEAGQAALDKRADAPQCTAFLILSYDVAFVVHRESSDLSDKQKHQNHGRVLDLAATNISIMMVT